MLYLSDVLIVFKRYIVEFSTNKNFAVGLTFERTMNVASIVVWVFDETLF